MLMKSLFTILFIGLSNILASQSWVNFELQADQYGGETTWEIVQGDSVFASGGPYGSFEYVQQLIPLPPGEYNLVVNDAFGDGICCDFGEGWFSIENTCSVSQSVYDFATSQMVVYFDLLPCPPPVTGCSDETANNYNPDAYLEDICRRGRGQCLGDNSPHARGRTPLEVLC